MTPVKAELLREELAHLQLAADHLQYSIERCRDLLGQEAWSPEQLERVESFTSRFARLADLLTQRVFRLIDEIELIGGGSLLDRIYRAEKRGWVEAAQLIRIRELRNLIAHEYATEKMPEIHAAVAALAPTLLATVPQSSPTPMARSASTRADRLPRPLPRSREAGDSDCVARWLRRAACRGDRPCPRRLAAASCRPTGLPERRASRKREDNHAWQRRPG